MTENQVKSPIKNMPDCWQDDKRMNVLFSPFRKRELNPVDYDSKMKFWNSIIIDWCLENNQCILTLSNLKAAFKRKGRCPSCLMTVLEELVRTGDVKTKTDLLNTKIPDSTWSGWANSLVKTPFVWSFSKLKEALSDIDANEFEYVYIGYLKVNGNNILTKVEKISDKPLYTIEEMRKLIEPPQCSLETAELLLHWLKIEGKVHTITLTDCELIKFANSPSSPQITDRDIAQYKLVKSKEALVKAISLLEEEKEKAIIVAKQHLSKGMKMAAKSSLRKKKALEECITRRISTLDNLDLLFTRIRDAQSDTEVYDSYKTGLSALKTTFKEAGLSEDTAMDTIMEMEEVSEMQDEIQNALSHLQASTDSELDEELESILSSAESKDEEESKFPAVPTTEPILVETDVKEILKIKKIEPIKFAYS